ncbi:hypothetical protein E2C01_078927 [Portunus trituberculatus]|uniref:Uncharacterized protein n=1 Tax=Portunus trituberculatus TaxID=210409 RepID=A0A5B7IU76_PORTR|nr:hypothetical protein [Portunus trituberculatus]
MRGRDAEIGRRRVEGGSQAEERRRKARCAGGCGQPVAHQVVAGEADRDFKAQEQSEGVTTVRREQCTHHSPQSNVHSTAVMHLFVTRYAGLSPENINNSTFVLAA